MSYPGEVPIIEQHGHAGYAECRFHELLSSSIVFVTTDGSNGQVTTGFKDHFAVNMMPSSDTSAEEGEKLFQGFANSELAKAEERCLEVSKYCLFGCIKVTKIMYRYSLQLQ